ncbi:hypothetical protein O9929_13930 [Vibrio lentus]|nr:hypothetical protein [Vibrio lentus]
MIWFVLYYQSQSLSVSELEKKLLRNYVEGGNSYDSIGFITLKFQFSEKHLNCRASFLTATSTELPINSQRQHRDADYWLSLIC